MGPKLIAWGQRWWRGFWCESFQFLLLSNVAKFIENKSFKQLRRKTVCREVISHLIFLTSTTARIILRPNVAVVSEQMCYWYAMVMFLLLLLPQRHQIIITMITIGFREFVSETEEETSSNCVLVRMMGKSARMLGGNNESLFLNKMFLHL